jgi:hypothetical protein
VALLYEKAGPLIRRVPTVIDTTDRILRFDSDNLYPQRAEETLKRAHTLKSLYDRIADFVNGEGFVDERLAGKFGPNGETLIPALIVNRKGLKGQTANKVLQTMTVPYVRYNKAFPMHVGYNLLGHICELNPIPFEYVRMGLKNKHGKVTHYAYSSNWERDSRKGNEHNIKFYPRFNPDPAVVLEQIAKCGGIYNYRGQILYLTPEEDVYPLASFDAVYDDAQVQNEVGMFKIGHVQNGFFGTTLFVYPGQYSSNEEKRDFEELIANKRGARNAGKRIGIQDPSGTKKASDIAQPLESENMDRQLEYTEKSIKENIVESEAFPAMLLGKTPTGLFAQGDMEEAYTYVNAITRNRRSELSEIFSLLFSYWETPIQTDAAIIEQRYIRNSAEGSTVDINDNLKGMSGREAMNFARILRKYARKQYDRTTAETLLRGGFGLSEEEIKKLLDGLDLAAEEEAQTPAAAGQPQPAKVAAYIVAMAKTML